MAWRPQRRPKGLGKGEKTATRRAWGGIRCRGYFTSSLWLRDAIPQHADPVTFELDDVPGTKRLT